MALVDTHAHLANHRFDGEIPGLLHRAREAGVVQVVTIGSDEGDSAKNVDLAAQHEPVFAAVGVHPTSVHETAENWIETIRRLAANPKVVAIGETGLDFYHPPRDGSSFESWRTLQESACRAQLELAIELDLPAVIHQRNSAEALFPLMSEYAGRLRAVLHCFSEPYDLATKYLDLGYEISFTANATFKNAGEIAETARRLPMDRFMVETDAPYLAPAPHRGKRNEPSFVRHTAALLADARGLSLDEFAERTTSNARRFFRLPSVTS